MRARKRISAATAKGLGVVRHFTRPGNETGFTRLVAATLNRHRRLALGVVFGGSILIGSNLALPHSRVASWLRNWHRTEASQQVPIRERDSARFKSIAPATHLNRGSDIRLLLSFAAPVLVLDAPQNLYVTLASGTEIRLSWTAPSGTVNYYRIERSTSRSGQFTTIGTSATTSFYNTGLSSIHSYLYRVRAVDSFGAPSAPSNMALGTSINFADPTLYAHVTEIKAQHIYDLRQAIDSVRALVPSLPTLSWTPYPLEQVIVHATDVQGLRDKLGDALSALDISPGAYEDPTLATGTNGTPIKKIHIEQLRERSTTGTSTSSGPADYSYGESSTARLDPLNRTGGGGEDPLSRNFNWSIPLVGLPGRGGLDLGLSLAYNSLATWTRTGSTISFDEDYGFPAPGFRLGFPVIQAAYYNSQASKYSFLMITPSGGRVELRQVGSSNFYQAVDSSYLLLDSSAMTLRTTDGTELTYRWMGSDYECTKIKDRNGNYLTVNYDSLDRISTVVDTLSRTITFNYDSNVLSSITQTWAGETHSWARFTYANKTIQTNFTNLTVNGPQNNSTIHALTQVKLADDSHYDFDYTTWGQVWKISQYTGESTAHLLNYRSYNLPADNSTAQTDCPRFTVRHDWAENWNRDTNGTDQEVNTTFAAPVDAALPDNSLATVSKAQVTLPDGTSQKIYFAGSVSGGAGSAPAWKRGLPLLTDTYEGSTIQRSASTIWTQDNESVSYQLNPRVIETNVYDPAGNRRRTTTEYSSFGLPHYIYEYAADGTTWIRRRQLDYKMDSLYVDRRIIGLPFQEEVCDNNWNLLSRTQYSYDEGGDHFAAQTPGTQYDDANYPSWFIVGRGNVTGVLRFNVYAPSDPNQAIRIEDIGYNRDGSVLWKADGAGHRVNLSYADDFSDGNNSRNTRAYPTTVTDPDGFSTSMRYNYDFGGATWKQTPSPNANAAGPEQTLEYDSFGRLKKVKNLVNNAYTRYEYPANQIRVDTYATILSTTTEAHSFKIIDGHGRVIGSAADHPGSTGGFSGQRIYYDTMGRAIKQSNPTETNASGNNPYSWAATGDDSTSNGGTGWVYTQQTYDWKGRPLVTTNTDSTIKSASYGGCGCAGSEIDTLTDEGTTVNGATKRRQQKIYHDVLGRVVKAEELNWDGSGSNGTGGTVYSATVNTYNARDQVTLVRQFEGPAPTDPNDLSCATGTATSFGTDTSWKQTQSPGAGWKNAGFDDSSWSAAADEGAFGIMPWSTWTDFSYNTPAHWIWYYDSRNGNDSSTVYFRKTFSAPASTISATLKIVADNGYTAYLNGNEVASGSNWKQAQTVTLSLTPGATYVLAVAVTNGGGPGGLLAELKSIGASCQQTTMSYDGYGRLQTKHVPQQQVDPLNNDSTDHTTFAYNADDTVQRVTDARGATATYQYNGRRLLTKIEYGGAGGSGTTLPSGVSATATTEFGYDAVGNRRSMSDGSGSTTFHYDQLSRLDWEERTFNGLTNPYRISYTYNLAGELKTITDPTQFGTSLGYQYDQSARLTAVTGSGYTYTDSANSQVQVSTFASNIYYRAWNMMKDMDDGNGVHHHFNFNSRLLASDYTLSNLAGSSGTMRWNYDYYADGNINHAYDVADNHFDRAFVYDHMGRLTEGYSGREARGETIPANTTPDSPYRHTYSYDVWSNQTGQIGRWWQRGLTVGYGYTNNRQQGMAYDAAGHVTRDFLGTHTFDARGARTLVTTGNVGGFQTGHPDTPAEEDANTFDGNGQPTKTVVTSRSEDLIGEGPATNITASVATTYYLRSSVLGGYVVAEMDAQGERTKGYVYAGGERLAEYTTTPYSHTIVWQHQNPLTGSWVEIAANSGTATRREMDPLGREVGTTAPPNPPDPTPPPPTREPLYQIEGGPTGEAELGMQLYEDFYINKNYGGGAGPGQGGFWEQWNNHATQLEGELMAGHRFLFGIDKMNATTGMSGDRYEEVNDSYAINVKDSAEGGGVGGSMTVVGLSYFRLVPGSGSPQNYALHNVWLQDSDLTKALSGIEAYLAKKPCADFLNGVLAELGKATGRGRDGVSFEDLFHAIPAGAFRVDSKLKVVANASPDGILIGNPSFTITIRSPEPFALMHEITHGSSREGANYTHYEMARAAWLVGNTMGVIYKMENFGLKDVTPNPNEDLAKTDFDKRVINNRNSSLFQAILIRACHDSK